MRFSKKQYSIIDFLDQKNKGKKTILYSRNPDSGMEEPLFNNEKKLFQELKEVFYFPENTLKMLFQENVYKKLHHFVESVLAIEQNGCIINENFGEALLFLYEIRQGTIRMMLCSISPSINRNNSFFVMPYFYNEFDFNSFKLDSFSVLRYDNKTMLFLDLIDPKNNTALGNSIFLQVLFLNFFEIEKYVVPSNIFNPLRLNGQTYCKDKTDTQVNVNIIDSKWFTTIIREDPFLVTGHFRMQPCGTGRTNKKLIWIQEYQKNGYVRKAKTNQEPITQEIL